MPWGRCDDGHYRHRKVSELDDDLRKGCLALYWLAVSWCNDQLTDGRVPSSTVRMLGGDVAEAEELVRVGLWEKDGKAYRIHDFLDYNKSRDQVFADRAQRSAAGALGAASRWGSDSGSPNGSYGGSLGDSSSEMHGGEDAPSPVPRTPVFPSPAPLARDGLPHITTEAQRLIEGLTGKPIRTAGDRQLTEYDRQLETHGLPAVTTAYRLVSERIKNPTGRQLVWSALRVLEPFTTPQDIAKAESNGASKAELERTRKLIESYERTAPRQKSDLTPIGDILARSNATRSAS